MTSGRGDEDFLAAGGPARHVPVLRDEVMAALAPREGGLYPRRHFWRGRLLPRSARPCRKAGSWRSIATPSRWPAEPSLSGEAEGRLELVNERFGKLDVVARERGLSELDGVVLDIGVSSMQVDDLQRGFSFRGDGPLDMRMDCAGISAADLVNTVEEKTLANILFYFGEERASRRIAHAIVTDRAKAPFTSTATLASMIARVAPGKPGEMHPATRVFQALRIAVNDELGELVRALVAAEAILKQGGRLVVVTFHSLEDRIVKQFFAGYGRGAAKRDLDGLPHEVAPPEPTFDVPGKQPVTPSAREISANPRARSAKLRHGEFAQVPARAVSMKA